MAKYTLIGIDPGVVDTGMAVITLDFKHKEWSVAPHAWRGVAKKVGQHIEYNEGMLDEIAETVQDATRDSTSYVGIEGYRQRGLNQKQDQVMLALVSTLRATLPGSQVIDNTGVKKIVPQKTLELFKAHRFPATNHADVKSAARIAIITGLKDLTMNSFIAEFMEDQLFGGAAQWELIST